MNIGTIKAGYRYLKKHGAKILWIRLQEKRQQGKTEYRKEFLDKEKDAQRLREQRHDSGQWFKRPLLSIVTPLYHTPEKFLRDMIESVMDSSYENWQLCLVDATAEVHSNVTLDLKTGASTEYKNSSFAEEVPRIMTRIEKIVREYQEKDISITGRKSSRIRYKKLPHNLGIAENTNQALTLAEGDYIAFLDHDDVITPDAIYEMMKAAREAEADGKEAELLYSDEDKTNEDRTSYFEPHFKPDFNPDLLRANNYITHFLVIKRSLLERVGGIRKEFDGAQDFDFILRCTEEAKGIVHVPKVLYHWRVHSLSTSGGGGSKDYAIHAGKKAIEAHLERMGAEGAADATPYFGFYHVDYKVPEYEIVDRFVCTVGRQKQDGLQKLQEMHESNTILGRQKSHETRVAETVRIKADCNPTKREKPQEAATEYVLIYNPALKPCKINWKEIFVADCTGTSAAIVGGKIYDSHYRIVEAQYSLQSHTAQYEGSMPEHCGQQTTASNNSNLKIVFTGLKRGYGGYMHRANLQMDCDAVSGRCMIVKKEILEEFPDYRNRLTEPDFPLEICEKVRKKGQMVMYEPFVTMQF